MNTFLQRLFIIIFPFLPFFAWGVRFFTDKAFEFFLGLFLLPFSIYYFLNRKNRLPKYLFFFILFTIYHITSSFINHTTATNGSAIYFILSDVNVVACIILVIVENIIFEEVFITKMSRYLFLVVIASLVVSLIQIKNISFFFNEIGPDQWGLLYLEEGRNFSIYSWTSYHTLGLSFPIMISILLSQNYFYHKSFKSIIIVLFGFTVCFLSRYRFAMISALIVSSQLIFINIKSFLGRIALLVIAVSSIIAIGFIAQASGFKIDEVINNRILEKESDMSSANARVTSVEVFLLKYPEYPWFGVGPETKADVIALLGPGIPIIHIGYLSYLYYYGVFGALIFFTSLFYLLQKAWKVGVKSKFWGGFFGIVSVCVANIAFVYFNFSEMGVVICMMYLRYYDCKNTTPLENSEVDTLETNLIRGKIYLPQQANSAT